jgi:hypothetical protein
VPLWRCPHQLRSHVESSIGFAAGTCTFVHNITVAWVHEIVHCYISISRYPEKSIIVPSILGTFFWLRRISCASRKMLLSMYLSRSEHQIFNHVCSSSTLAIASSLNGQLLHDNSQRKPRSWFVLSGNFCSVCSFQLICTLYLRPKTVCDFGLKVWLKLAVWIAATT